MKVKILNIKSYRYEYLKRSEHYVDYLLDGVELSNIFVQFDCYEQGLKEIIIKFHEDSIEKNRLLLS